jgi:hypothetical protein
MNFTVQTPDADDAQVLEAMGRYLNLGRPATQDEIEDLLARYLGGSIDQMVRRAAVEQAIAAAEAAAPAIGVLTSAAAAKAIG